MGNYSLECLAIYTFTRRWITYEGEKGSQSHRLHHDRLGHHTHTTHARAHPQTRKHSISFLRRGSRIKHSWDASSIFSIFSARRESTNEKVAPECWGNPPPQGTPAQQTRPQTPKNQKKEATAFVNFPCHALCPCCFSVGVGCPGLLLFFFVVGRGGCWWSWGGGIFEKMLSMTLAFFSSHTLLHVCGKLYLKFGPSHVLVGSDLGSRVGGKGEWNGEVTPNGWPGRSSSLSSSSAHHPHHPPPPSHPPPARSEVCTAPRQGVGVRAGPPIVLPAISPSPTSPTHPPRPSHHPSIHTVTPPTQPKPRMYKVGDDAPTSEASAAQPPPSSRKRGAPAPASDDKTAAPPAEKKAAVAPAAAAPTPAAPSGHVPPRHHEVRHRPPPTSPPFSLPAAYKPLPSSIHPPTHPPR